MIEQACVFFGLCELITNNEKLKEYFKFIKCIVEIEKNYFCLSS